MMCCVTLLVTFDLEVKGHQQWYATHHLEVFYLHAKYAKPVLNDKKSYSPDTICYGRTDRLITIEHPPQSGGALINFHKKNLQCLILSENDGSGIAFFRKFNIDFINAAL